MATGNCAAISRIIFPFARRASQLAMWIFECICACVFGVGKEAGLSGACWRSRCLVLLFIRRRWVREPLARAVAVRDLVIFDTLEGRNFCNRSKVTRHTLTHAFFTRVFLPIAIPPRATQSNEMYSLC